MMRAVLFRHLPPWEQPAVPKEQSKVERCLKRFFSVFLRDEWNTFPLPTAILLVRRWSKIRVVTSGRLLLLPRSRA